MKLVSHPPFVVPYFELCAQMGRDIVDTMVSDRLLAYRPTHLGAFDVTVKDLRIPYVLAGSTAIRTAMLRVLKDVKD